MSEQTDYTLTAEDAEALQQARARIERVKEAIFTGKRGEDWHAPLRQTFHALYVAEGLLRDVVVAAGSGNTVAERDQIIGDALDVAARQIADRKR